MPLPPASLLLVLGTLNLLVAALFALDKSQARRGGRRVREATLLVLALLGGSPAAWLARHLLRHKTRKQPFSRRLLGITLLQVAALGLWLGR